MPTSMRIVAGLLCVLASGASRADNATASKSTEGSMATPSFTGPELDAGIHAARPRNYDITRSFLVRALSKPDALARSARIVPCFAAGASVGMKLFAVQPDSVLGRLGLLSGDCVRSVNGHPFASPGDVLDVYSSVAQVSEFRIVIDRASAPTTLTWRVRESR